MLPLASEPAITIYAATGNKGKLAEFVRCAGAVGVTVLPLPGLAEMTEPVEDAATFMGNAEKKAVAYSLLAPGLMVMADDSGLETNELNGEPGVRSARYADDAGFMAGMGEKKDTRNNELLLMRLRLSSGFADRGARFVCALAVARDGQVLYRAEGEVEGEILHAPRGEDGFGYDPLFLLPQLGKTMAELAPEEKWALSHRGNAFRALLRSIQGTPAS